MACSLCGATFRPDAEMGSMLVYDSNGLIITLVQKMPTPGDCAGDEGARPCFISPVQTQKKQPHGNYLPGDSGTTYDFNLTAAHKMDTFPSRPYAALLVYITRTHTHNEDI